jgi:hypothetical protein
LSSSRECDLRFKVEADPDGPRFGSPAKKEYAGFFQPEAGHLDITR